VCLALCGLEGQSWKLRLVIWLGIALFVIFAVVFVVLVWIQIRWRDPSSPAAREDGPDWWWPMIFVGACCPPLGFLLGQLVGGDAQPAAFSVPLQGAMLGWAVTGLLHVAVPTPRSAKPANDAVTSETSG
jgi:hypothetical protein